MKNAESYLSDLIKTIPPSGIRKFFDLASTIEGVISLGVGEPDFDTPSHIRDEAISAIQSGKTFYTANTGLPELRRQIAAYLKRRFDLNYQWQNQIIATVGGSEAIDITMRTLLNPSDEVICCSPGYVAYEPCIRLAQGEPVLIELKEENQFKLTCEDLKKALSPKTKAILINFPGNPTGGIMTKADFEPLVKVIKESGILVITDEIYAELTYDEEHCSIAWFEEIKDQVILISGFSKAYSMTGWRLGYLCAHETFVAAMNKVHQYAIMCPPTISQYAGIEALRRGDEVVQEMKASFEMRRNSIVKGLNRIGLKCHFPQGAFYVFPSIQCTGLSSDEFCEKLLQEEKVAVVPGNAFGSSGEGFVRISYAYSINEIEEALKRMERFMKRLNNKV